MSDKAYALVRVAGHDQWEVYHDIRGRTLFDDRGHLGRYDRNHPDDRKPNNHPLLLLYRNVPVGAMRVDLYPDDHFAIMRTVAIPEDHQRRGHGRAMLTMAEDYVLGLGCRVAVTIAANDAVPFYEKCGYEPHDWDPNQRIEQGTQMRKLLAQP